MMIGPTNMRTKVIVSVLLLSGILCAKDKSLNDYPINFTVNSTLYDDPSSSDLNHKCRMFLKEGSRGGYSVYSNGLCTTFSPGNVVAGRFTTFWGVRMIELAWQDKKGRIKTCKYTIASASS